MRILSILFLIAASMGAQQAAPAPRGTVIRATGEAVVPVRTDQTILRLDLTSSSSKAGQAAAKNAERTTQLIASLRELLGKDANIRTLNYRLGGYSKNTVENVIEVHVQDPALAGKVIDLAAKHGASVSTQVTASAMAQEGARTEALRQAAVQARTNAEAIARALGLRVVRVVLAETMAPPASVGTPVIGATANRMEARAPTTPIEAGSVEVHAQMAVTLEAEP